MTVGVEQSDEVWRVTQVISWTHRHTVFNYCNFHSSQAMLGLCVVPVEYWHQAVGLQLLAAVPSQLPVFSTDTPLPNAAVHPFSALPWTRREDIMSILCETERM